MDEGDDLDDYEESERYDSALVFGGQNYWDGEDEPEEHDDDWYKN